MDYLIDTTGPVTLSVTPSFAPERHWVWIGSARDEGLTVDTPGETLTLEKGEGVLLFRGGKARRTKGGKMETMTTVTHNGPRGSVGFTANGEPVGEEFGAVFPVGTGDTVEVAAGEFWRLDAIPDGPKFMFGENTPLRSLAVSNWWVSVPMV